MQRVLTDTPATISQSWYEDGTIVDPGVVTIGITREDGTELVAAGAATSGTGAAARTYNLTTTHTASLDVLTVTWTSASKGTMVQTVEVVGGYLFSLTDARAVKPLDNTTTYTAAELIEGRTLAETALEDACGVAFVPRYFRVRVDGTGDTDLLLPHPRPLTITSVTVDGTALTADELADLEFYDTGVLYNPLKWAEGRRNVVVKGTHGYPYPPARVGRACVLLAKRFLVDSPINDRATSITTEDGASQFFVTAGVRDAVFDVPECNAVVERYGLNRGV